MISFFNEKNVGIDVDQTLLFRPKRKSKGCFYIYDPISKKKILVKPHKKHVQLLKDLHSRGYDIIVWSFGSGEWAKAAVDALKLNKYVKLTMPKLIKFIDDLPAEEVLGKRIYLKDE